MFSYRKILQQAWTLTKTNRFLWAYGLLLFLGQILNFGYNLSSQTNVTDKLSKLNWAWLQNILNHSWVGWALIVLACLWLLVYFRASGGIILAVKSLIDKQPTKPLVPFYFARFFVTRLLGLVILWELVLFVLSLIISTPVVYLISIGLVSRAMILGIFGSVVAIPFLLLIVFINIIGPLFIVIFNLPFWTSIKASINFITSFWRKLLAFGALLFFVALIVFALIGAVTAMFVILAIISYHRGGSPLIFVLLLTLGSAIFLAAGAVLVSFEQVAWVILFEQLVKPQKLEEEEAEVVPEQAAS